MLFLKFYKTEIGRSPVEKFIRNQTKLVTAKIIANLAALCNEFPDLKTVETKHLRGQLWEIKQRLDNRNYRIIYTVIGTDLLLLHGFTKKKGRAQDEIKLAEERLKDYLKRLKR